MIRLLRAFGPARPRSRPPALAPDLKTQFVRQLLGNSGGLSRGVVSDLSKCQIFTKAQRISLLGLRFGKTSFSERFHATSS
jgi:hypothetical protein